MRRYDVVMRERGPREQASGPRPEARQRFVDYLRIRDALIQQDIVDGDVRSSNTHSPRTRDLKIRLARTRQEIVDRDTKSSNQGVSPLRRQMRREKIQRDRYRRYFANETFKSSNLDLKFRCARLRQDLVDMDLMLDGLIPQASRRGA